MPSETNQTNKSGVRKKEKWLFNAQPTMKTLEIPGNKLAETKQQIEKEGGRVQAMNAIKRGLWELEVYPA